MSKSDPTSPARLIPQLAFPPYSYVTGKFPHPIRDPQGHLYGHPQRAVARLDPAEWRQCESYRFGIDLFNHGFYWEAHEAWEGVWHAVQRTGDVADFLKGLIKLAAAGVKAREGRAEGVRRHATRARELFLAVSDGNPDAFAGLSLSTLTRLCDMLSAAPQKYLNSSDQPVVVVLPSLT